MPDFVATLKKYSDYVSLKGSDTQSIESAEKCLSLKFSDDFRKYVKECGIASADGHEFTGIVESNRLNVVDATIRAREANPLIPADLYVVEEMQVDHIITWQSGDGSIYQTVGKSAPEKICDSLSEYMEQ